MTTRSGRRVHAPVRPRLPAPFPTREEPPDRGYNPGVQRRPPKAVKRTWVNAVTNDIRQTLLTPTIGRRIRVIRLWALTLQSDSSNRWLEVYFGTGADASAAPTKVIDILILPTTGTAVTRTYDSLSVGRGPTGLVNEVVSYRWRNAPLATHGIIIEYVEELSQRRA